MFGNNNNTSWRTVILVKLTGPQLVKEKKPRYILWRKVHYHFHNSTSPVPVLSQINADHASSDFLKIHFNIINPFTPRSSTLSLPLKHPHQNRVCTSALSLRTTCIAHRIFLDFITWMIFSEEYRAKGSSFYSLLRSSVTLSRLSLNAFLSTLVSNIFSPCFSLSARDQASHPYKSKLYFCIF